MIIPPTIGTLRRLEQRSGMRIRDLVALLNAGSPPEPIAELLATEFPSTTNNIELRNTLLEGIGFIAYDDVPLPADTLKTLPDPDWLDMFKIYVGIMGHSAQEFWQLTLEEYTLALDGFCLLHHIYDEPAPITATRQELDAMMAEFPDR